MQCEFNITYFAAKHLFQTWNKVSIDEYMIF